MVSSYYNQMQAMAAYNQKSNLPYSSSQPWYQNYHQPHNAFADSENTHAMYYTNPHLFHQASPDWTADNYPTSHSSILQASQAAIQLNQHAANNDHINDGINSVPSPPITVAGSEMSSPGAPNSNGSPHNPRPTPAKSPYEWIKKTSYQHQLNPENWSMNSGKPFGKLTEIEDDSPDINYTRRKTRTKDKYRVVYSDYQRLELEKEYHTAKYITIRRKSELATSLQLSERQVKIWFQNRRAKDRKQCKKREETGTPGSMSSMTHQNPSMSHLVDVKPKIEPGLNMHPLHQMSAMSLGMPPMGLHHPSLHHMGVPTSQQLHAHHAAQAQAQAHAQAHAHAQHVQAHVQAAQAQAQAQAHSPSSLNI